ncbi:MULTISPECIES: hypothetical protein [Legionella]|uniref:Uncharacterized protein n=1 Tax=Legionella resiliens TaxID=2905958 RepID=A0ABS8X6T2_9GAMM|nr:MULTISPECIES: hypothetical protein [unclassified Legionella]MCE0724344.1 hypothetical protein [Legionella sp. 9fVS26]MCE3533496.1 hypothetical protein [Legionella sp. 8cVS16]QLZ69683.1 hypothetical protein FOLKNPGA_02481 [Legionella sp. PC1000]
MPTLYDIIAMKRNMDINASKFYREIETWYRQDENGYIVHEPMNIPAKNVGSSAKPLQHFSYLLARGYFGFLSADLSKDDIKEGQEFFSHHFVSDKKLKELPAKVSFYPVVERFFPNLNNFIRDMEQLCSMSDKYAPNDTNDIEDLKLLMQDYMDTLLANYGYTPTVIKTACQRVMADMPVSTEKPTISLKSVWSMEKDFYRLQSRSFSYSISDKDNSVSVKQNDSEEKQVNKLSKFLSTHLWHAEWLKLFKDIFIDYTIQNKQDTKWHPDSFWSSELTAPQTEFVADIENSPKI